MNTYTRRSSESCRKENLACSVGFPKLKVYMRILHTVASEKWLYTHDSENEKIETEDETQQKNTLKRAKSLENDREDDRRESLI